MLQHHDFKSFFSEEENYCANMVITIDHESYHSHSISHNYPNKTLLPLCAVLYCICMLCVMPVATSQKTFPVVPLALGLSKSRMEL